MWVQPIYISKNLSDLEFLKFLRRAWQFDSSFKENKLQDSLNSLLIKFL